MNGDGAIRRLRAISKRLASPEVEHAIEEAKAAALDRRIDTGTATVADFEQRVVPRLDAWRQRLYTEALNRCADSPPHSAESAPPSEERLGGPAWDAAIAIVCSDPGSPIPESHYEHLQAMAAMSPTGAGPANGAERDLSGWRSSWASANIALLVLGPDRGMALRAVISPHAQRALEEANATRARRQREARALIDGRIANGTAGWSTFYVKFLPQYDQDHHLVVEAALARREARLSGHPREVRTNFDHAAEILSYPRHEEPPRIIMDTLEFCCDAAAPSGTPGHDEWVDANRWGRAMGGGWGAHTRKEIHTMDSHELPDTRTNADIRGHPDR